MGGNINIRKLVLMDLVLALIVLTLFALAPPASNSRDANLDLNQVVSDAESGDDGGVFGLPSSPRSLMFRMSMETASGSALQTDYGSEMPE